MFIVSQVRYDIVRTSLKLESWRTDWLVNTSKYLVPGTLFQFDLHVRISMRYDTTGPMAGRHACPPGEDN